MLFGAMQCFLHGLAPVAHRFTVFRVLRAYSVQRAWRVAVLKSFKSLVDLSCQTKNQREENTSFPYRVRLVFSLRSRVEEFASGFKSWFMLCHNSRSGTISVDAGRCRRLEKSHLFFDCLKWIGSKESSGFGSRKIARHFKRISIAWPQIRPISRLVWDVQMRQKWMKWISRTQLNGLKRPGMRSCKRMAASQLDVRSAVRILKITQNILIILLLFPKTQWKQLLWKLCQVTAEIEKLQQQQIQSMPKLHSRVETRVSWLCFWGTKTPARPSGDPVKDLARER